MLRTRFTLSVLLLTVFFLATSSLLGAAETREGGDVGPITVSPNDWPWWRGPQRNGIAAADQKPPMTWSDKENIVWKTPGPVKAKPWSPYIPGNDKKKDEPEGKSKV